MSEALTEASVHTMSVPPEDKLHTTASILSGISTLERAVCMLTSYQHMGMGGQKEVKS